MGISNKKYSDSVVGLERLADGIQLHSGEEGFPLALKEETVRTCCTTMGDKRQNYEQKNNEALRAYDEFEAFVKECDAEMAKWRSALYSFYGKKDPRLMDFGINPWKTKKKGAPEPEGQPQE